MKVLTLNFLTCAVKACKTNPASYPLHPKDAELAHEDLELNATLLVNILPRIDWPALVGTAAEVSLLPLPSSTSHVLQATHTTSSPASHLCLRLFPFIRFPAHLRGCRESSRHQRHLSLRTLC